MNTAMMIFTAGLGGVFVGMGMLYAAIKLISAVVGRWVDKPATGKGDACGTA